MRHLPLIDRMPRNARSRLSGCSCWLRSARRKPGPRRGSVFALLAIDTDRGRGCRRRRKGDERDPDKRLWQHRYPRSSSA